MLVLCRYLNNDVTSQIAYEIEFKIEAKYMLLFNLNVSDSLTNGSKKKFN